MQKRPRIKEGDLFVFDVREDNVAAGQVVFKNVAGFNLYAIFFKPLWPRNGPFNLAEIIASEIHLVGGTMDARIAHGMWRIIGNIRPDLSKIPLPWFKIMIE